MIIAVTPLGMNTYLVGEENLNWLFRNDRKAVTDVSWPPNIRMLMGPYALANQFGKYHRTLRRTFEPFFTPAFVQNYYAEYIDRATNRSLEAWSLTNQFVSSEVFKFYALELFFVSAFGSDDYDTNILRQLHDDFMVLISGFFVFLPKQVPGSTLQKAMGARDRILKTIDTLIEKFTKKNPEASERAKNTMIGRLVYGKNEEGTGNALNRDEIRDNVLNFIFAGHDTTYASISTILHHLGQHPTVLEALSSEIAELKSMDTLDCDELKQAPLLNAVIFESLRLDPPVIGGFRKANKDVANGEFLFEKNCVFNYSIWLTVRDKNTYNDADSFKVGRFLPKDHPMHNENVPSPIDPSQGKSSYPVFGGGTHVCLGKNFALLELRILLVRMLGQYDVEVQNDRKVVVPFNAWQVEFKLKKKKNNYSCAHF